MDQQTHEEGNPITTVPAVMQHTETVQKRRSLATITPKVRLVLALGLSIIIIITVVGFIAKKSLPGTALYTTKTDILERVCELTHITRKGEAQYQVQRMQNRLDEVKTLSSQENVSEEALTDLTTQTTRHYQKLNTLVLESIDSAFAKTDVLYTLNEFASVATAIENISEHDSTLTPLGDHVEEIRQDTLSLYKDRVESFVQTETSATVFTFLQERLTEVNAELQDTSLSAETLEFAESYLDRVEGAMTSKKFARGITAIAEAYRFIRVDKLGGYREDIMPAENSTATSSIQGSSTQPLSTSTTILTP